MPNPRLRKNVAKEYKKNGTTMLPRRTIKKKLFTNPSQIREPKLRENFDLNKSWMENLTSANLEQMYGESLPESIPAKAAWTISKLSENEVAVVRRLVASHGSDNFKKMAFDRKLNAYQWTEQQCEKKVRMLLEDNLVHVCDDGKCLCGYTPNSSYVSKEGRIRR